MYSDFGSSSKTRYCFCLKQMLTRGKVCNLLWTHSKSSGFGSGQNLSPINLSLMLSPNLEECVAEW